MLLLRVLVREHPCGVGSLPSPLCELWKWNSDCQASEVRRRLSGHAHLPLQAREPESSYPAPLWKAGHGMPTCTPRVVSVVRQEDHLGLLAASLALGSVRGHLKEVTGGVAQQSTWGTLRASAHEHTSPGTTHTCAQTRNPQGLSELSPTAAERRGGCG